MSSTTQQKSHKSTILLLILMVMVITAIVIYVGIIRPEQLALNARNIKIDGVVLTPTKDITDFQLIDNHEQPFTKAQLKGHWTLMFFGFTNCAMVCPATMVALNKTYQLLEKELPDNQLPHIVMVSVDPERDTTQKMNTYVTTFNPHFIGTHGNLSETTALEKQLHIVAVKKQAEGASKNDYYYDHSAEVLVFNPEGKLQAYLSYPHKPEQMAKDYKLLLQTIAG